jgi:urease accessory protein
MLMNGFSEGPNNISLAATSETSSILPPISLTQSRRAIAALTFATDPSGKTFLAAQRAEHPFHLTRPFQFKQDPEGMVTLYLQSSSGGLYRGDELKMDVKLEENTQLHLTTQASTIVHHTRGQTAKQSLNLTLAKNSYCEYLPDPTVLFSGAAFCSDIRVEIAENARLLLSDSFSWHDPRYKNRPADEVADQAFDCYHSTIEIFDQKGKTIVLDRFRLTGEVALSQNCAVHGEYEAQGTILFIDLALSDQVLPAIREMLHQVTDCYAGASKLPNHSGLIIRFLAKDNIALQRILQQSWSLLREQLFGKTPQPRRK